MKQKESKAVNKFNSVPIKMYMFMLIIQSIVCTVCNCNLLHCFSEHCQIPMMYASQKFGIFACQTQVTSSVSQDTAVFTIVFTAH